MKSVVKKVFMVMFASLFVISLSAQDGKSKKTPEQMASQQSETMIKQLNLTPDQSTKVKEINLNYAQKLVDARKDKNKEEMKSLIKAKDAEIKAVLTKDQYKQWRESQKATAEKAQKKGGKKAKTE